MVSTPIVANFVGAGLDIFDLCNTVYNFVGGKTGLCISVWSTFVQFSDIKDILSGYLLEFSSTPVPSGFVRPLVLSIADRDALDSALASFVDRQIIERVPALDCDDSYVSNVFPVMKKDGLSARVILNLRPLNKCIVYRHFKMDSLQSVLPLIKKDNYFASIDLVDAYFSVPVAPSERKWLRFLWNGVLFQYTCMPQGLTSAPRLFTKLLKPVLAHLRSVGISIIMYIDDALIIADSASELRSHVSYTVHFLDSLGLTINMSKSELVPVQSIQFLGFTLDSCTMTVRLTHDKVEKIVSLGQELLSAGRVSIRSLASFIGSVVASEPGAPCAPLRFRYLEYFKYVSLIECRGDYEGLIALSDKARSVISWWIDNVPHLRRDLLQVPPQFTLFTDASLTGWGAVLGDVQTKGHWALDEVVHINVLELKAVLFGLRALCADLSHVHLRLVADNTTVVACIERKGSMRPVLQGLTEDIFEWALVRDIELSAAYLPGIENVTADSLSRDTTFDHEWMVLPDVFAALCARFGTPVVDLFATRINHQLPSFVSWYPDPYAVRINAFSFAWDSSELYYAFPPFSVISRVLRKVEADRATVLLVAPVWPTQVWFPRLLSMLVDAPVFLPRKCLTLPQSPESLHPLGRRLALAGMVICGDPLSRLTYRQRLGDSCFPPVRRGRWTRMTDISLGGSSFVSQGKSIRFCPL